MFKSLNATVWTFGLMRISYVCACLCAGWYIRVSHGVFFPLASNSLRAAHKQFNGFGFGCSSFSVPKHNYTIVCWLFDIHGKLRAVTTTTVPILM